MIDAPSSGAPEQAPRWDLVDTESCGSGIRVLAPVLIIWGYVEEGVHRWSNRGPTRVEGALRGVGAPPTSWLPILCLDVGSKSPGSCSLRKSRSRSFHSVWTPFDIPFLRNTEIGKKTAIRAGPPVSRLVLKMI